MAFASVEDLAAFLQRDLTELTDAADLALELATAAIQAEAGQQLTQATDTITVAPLGTVVLLPELPVTAVTAVMVAGVALTSTDYTCSTLGILRRVDGAAWAGRSPSLTAMGSRPSPTTCGRCACRPQPGCYATPTGSRPNRSAPTRLPTDAPRVPVGCCWPPTSRRWSAATGHDH
jgi:hypothetical protein